MENVRLNCPGNEEVNENSILGKVYFNLNISCISEFMFKQKFYEFHEEKVKIEARLLRFHDRDLKYLTT